MWLVEVSRWEVVFRRVMIESVKSRIAGTIFSWSVVVGDMAVVCEVGVGVERRMGKKRYRGRECGGERGGDVLS